MNGKRHVLEGVWGKGHFSWKTHFTVGLAALVLVFEGLTFSLSAANPRVGHGRGPDMSWRVEVIQTKIGKAIRYGRPAKIGETVWILRSSKDPNGVVKQRMNKERIRFPMRGRRLQITFHGEHLSYQELEYMDALGEKLVGWFKQQFGWEIKPNFYFDVTLFDSKEAWIKAGNKENALGSASISNSTVDNTPLKFYVDRLDKTGQAWREFEISLLHEMSHATTWHLYGPWPTSVEEGLAEWISWKIGHGGAEIYRSKDPVAKVGYSVFLSGGDNWYLDTLMSTYSYDHWDYVFRNEYKKYRKDGVGRAMVGYTMPAYFVDFLMSDKGRTRAFKIAINRAHNAKSPLPYRVANIEIKNGEMAFSYNHWDKVRQDAFRKNLDRNYRGGLNALGKDWKQWMVKRLSRPPMMSGGNFMGGGSLSRSSGSTPSPFPLLPGGLSTNSFPGFPAIPGPLPSVPFSGSRSNDPFNMPSPGTTSPRQPPRKRNP